MITTRSAFAPRARVVTLNRCFHHSNTVLSRQDISAVKGKANSPTVLVSSICQFLYMLRSHSDCQSSLPHALVVQRGSLEVTDVTATFFDAKKAKHLTCCKTRLVYRIRDTGRTNAFEVTLRLEEILVHSFETLHSWHNKAKQAQTAWITIGEARDYPSVSCFEQMSITAKPKTKKRPTVW